MHSLHFKKELYLFGEDRFDFNCEVMFLVEGMFDAIFLSMKGIPNVGAMCGSWLSKLQVNKIVKWFKKLVIIPDGDPAGVDAAERIMKQLGKRINTFVFDTPTGSDPDQLKDEHLADLTARFLI
jgi:DNA primase